MDCPQTPGIWNPEFSGRPLHGGRGDLSDSGTVRSFSQDGSGRSRWGWLHSGRGYSPWEHFEMKAAVWSSYEHRERVEDEICGSDRRGHGICLVETERVLGALGVRPIG